MKYRCIIIDDNIIECDSLALKLKQIACLEIYATLSSGLEAVNILRDNKIDIVFSDIDMQGLSCIELLKSTKNHPVFIFISSHPEYAVESFSLNVIDYIVKPVKLERLIHAANKAIEYIQLKKLLNNQASPKASSPDTGNNLIKTIDAQAYFFIKDASGYTRLDMGDVLYIESMGDFSKIHTTSQKTHLVLVSLKNLEKQLPASFFIRVHKQYMVNLLYIKNITVGEILLKDNNIIPISTAYKQALLDTVVHKKTLTRFGE